jgi:acyl-[acyl-carrier-protein] desaturase
VTAGCGWTDAPATGTLTYGTVTYVGVRWIVVEELTQVQLLTELEPVVERELGRHLAVAKEWFPHEYVPWTEGTNFDGAFGGQAWDPEQSRVSPVARTALVVNLLTEDNLPGYHRVISKSFGRDSVWGAWVDRWTAEEGRHGIALRDYLLVTRAVDPVQLERERMQHMGGGFELEKDEMLRSIAYVSFQELATRISHRNTGRYTEDPACEQLLARIAQDENLHMIFYRNLLQGAFEVAPDQTLEAVRDVVESFQMPGHTIQDFGRRSVQMAMAGIYDLRIHRDEVLAPVLRKWRVWDREGLSARGERAREELDAMLAALEGQASRFEDKRATYLARQAERGQAVYRPA